LPLLDQALAQGADHAGAWYQRAMVLQRLEREREALDAYERALALEPRLHSAWTQRGNILKLLDRHAEAAASFRNAIAHGADPVLHGYYLAGLTGEEAPPAPPRQYVESLFDEYAATFDEHLVESLGYRAHRALIAQVQALGPRRFRSALDLGCGTGLCGPLAKAIADRVDGVDLSAAMLDKARALGIYDRLDHADVVQHLANTERRYDLVLAADVFIYVGALEAVFDGVARVLEPGGVFAFSVERADAGEPELALRPSLRYAHAASYLRRLAAQRGFEVVRLQEQRIRREKLQSIFGLYAVLRSAPAT
jgi:predicted TPR repeat methyltransferase